MSVIITPYYFPVSCTVSVLELQLGDYIAVVTSTNTFIMRRAWICPGRLVRHTVCA